MIDLSQSRIAPYAHQSIGVEKIIAHPFFFLCDEMGAGKTKQTIDAACALFAAGVIDRVLVISPAAVRAVWFDPELGELKKHLWESQSHNVLEYHSRNRMWSVGKGNRCLRWVVTNYDYIRKGFEGKGRNKQMVGKLKEVASFCTPKTLLVLDESSAVKNNTAAQTKACFALRQLCGRVILLNGTPITNSPSDLYAQGNILHTSILECRSFTYFKSRYARMGGWENRQIVGWLPGGIEDIQRRFAPYVLRREKKDCLDLPEKLPPVMVYTALTDATWAVYKQMRDELVVWLSENIVATASIAMVKSLRLAQITSGFLGGIEEALPDDKPVSLIVEVGREKLHDLLAWVEERLEENPSSKFIVWCRFIAEVQQTIEALSQIPGLTVGSLYGENTRDERARTLRLLDPRTAPLGPVGVVGTIGTGALGLNLTAADKNWYRSLDRSSRNLKQSQDRTHRPGQVNPVSYFYQLATGPKGQKTIDHVIARALQNNDDIAQWTQSAWVKALTEE